MADAVVRPDPYSPASTSAKSFTLTAPADADPPSRVTLPDPNLGPTPSGGTAAMRS
jgi:hypothetical protein